MQLWAAIQWQPPGSKMKPSSLRYSCRDPSAVAHCCLARISCPLAVLLLAEEVSWLETAQKSPAVSPVWQGGCLQVTSSHTPGLSPSPAEAANPCPAAHSTELSSRHCPRTAVDPSPSHPGTQPATPGTAPATSPSPLQLCQAARSQQALPVGPSCPHWEPALWNSRSRAAACARC